MWDASKKLGQVLEYMRLAASTPDLAPYLARPIVGEIVTAQHDPLAQQVIQAAGIRYVHFEPPWIDEFYALYPKRRRRAAWGGDRAEMDESANGTPSTP